MLRLFLLVLMLILPIPTYSQSYLRKLVHPTVVTLANDRGYSSGSMVIISPKYALSAAHVFKKYFTYGGSVVAIIAGKEVQVTLAKYDLDKDLVLLQGEFTCPCAPIGNDPNIDDPVALVGFPYWYDYKVQILTFGTVQGINHKFVVAGVTAAPGVSGGGLFSSQDGEQKLVGIAAQVATPPTDNPFYPRYMLNWLSFHVKPSLIRQFLQGMVIQ